MDSYGFLWIPFNVRGGAFNVRGRMAHGARGAWRVNVRGRMARVDARLESTKALLVVPSSP